MGAISKAKKKAQAAKVKARFKAREARGLSGLTGGQKGSGIAGTAGSTIGIYRMTQKQRREAAAKERDKKYQQTKVRPIDGHTKKRYTNAEKRRIEAAGYTVEGYGTAAYSEDGGRAARESRQKKIDNFNAKNYLSKYKDLQAAFGTDEAAAKRHFLKHGLDEGRDSTPAKVETTAPAGAFGISAAGKAQAEANKLAAAQSQKTYEQNRIKEGDKFKNEAGVIRGNIDSLSDALGYASANPIAFAKDVGQYINNPEFRQDFDTTFGNPLQHAHAAINPFVSAPDASFNTALQIAGTEGGFRDKLDAFAKADTQDIKDLATSGIDLGLASNLTQNYGEQYGLNPNFKMQISDARDKLKEELGKITIGDRDSTYQVISDFARDIGTDPAYGAIARGAFQAQQGTGTLQDKIIASFDPESEKIEGLSMAERGLIEGALGNRMISGKLTDIAMEGYEGNRYSLTDGTGFDANTLAQLSQNIAGNFGIEGSVANQQAESINTMAQGGKGITIPSIIEAETGLNIQSIINPFGNQGGGALNTGQGGSNLNTTTDTDQTIAEDDDDEGSKGFTGETIGGGETGVVGGGDNEGGTGGDSGGTGSDTGDTGDSGSTGTGTTGTGTEGNVSGYNDSITNIPGTNYDINEALRGLRFDDPDYRARLRRRRRNLLGFRGTFTRPSRMTIAA